MLPRHPLLFKVTTIFVLVSLVGVMLYNSKPTIIITRNFVVVTRAPNPFTEEMQTKGTPNVTSKVTTARNTTIKPNTTTTSTTTHSPTTEQYKHIVDGKNLEFLINQNSCVSGTYLMIYIHSGPENSERRRVIRSTWGTPDILQRYHAKLVFVMGEPDDENTQAAVENESEVYQDIVQGNFTDAYRNLTYKAITGLKWVTENCGDAVYVLKTDDDIIVDIHRVVRLMRAYLEKKWGVANVLGGYMWPHMDVNRNKSSKWYTSPEDYAEAFFKVYLSGSAYIMSTDVVKQFYIKSHEVPFFWVDDYYVTGMLAHALNIDHNSLNDRYILENTADIKGRLEKDKKTRLVFIHSPNTNTSNFAWQKFVDRWV